MLHYLSQDCGKSEVLPFFMKEDNNNNKQNVSSPTSISKPHHNTVQNIKAAVPAPKSGYCEGKIVSKI